MSFCLLQGFIILDKAVPLRLKVFLGFRCTGNFSTWLQKEGRLVLGVMTWACQDAAMDQGTEEEQKPSCMMAREGRNIFVILCCRSLPDHWIRQGWLYMFISLAVSHFFKSSKHKVDVSNIIHCLHRIVNFVLQTLSFPQWCWFLGQVLYS